MWLLCSGHTRGSPRFPNPVLTALAQPLCPPPQSLLHPPLPKCWDTLPWPAGMYPCSHQPPKGTFSPGLAAPEPAGVSRGGQQTPALPGDEFTSGAGCGSIPGARCVLAPRRGDTACRQVALWPSLNAAEPGGECLAFFTSPPALRGRTPRWRRGAGLLRAAVAEGRGTLALHGICFPLAHQGHGPGLAEPRGSRGKGQPSLPNKRSPAVGRRQCPEPSAGAGPCPGLLGAAASAHRCPRCSGGWRRPQPPVPPLGVKASTDGGSWRPAATRALLPPRPRRIPPRA